MARKHKIPFYKAEAEDGIADKVQTSGSIAYLTKLEDTKISQEIAQEFLRSIANDVDETQFDLFYLNTILVTTGWNKNNDVFAKVPTWDARYSPIHKQFNLEHDQSKIIGHMTSAKAVDEKFAIIADDTTIDNLPDKFHILTGAVIYRSLSDEKAQEQIEKIIEEIGNGEWYVSMECLFRGFDYAITSATGEQRVIPRDESSAYLTKYLRQYGGEGKYENYSIGRCLSSITFSGKGLVRKPANPESIIFNEKVSAFITTYENLGYINSSTDNNLKNTKEISMANENLEVDKLTDKLNASVAENTKLKEDIKAFESSATTAKITSLESDVADKAKAIEALNTDLSGAKAEVVTLKESVKALEDRAVKAELELKTLKAEKLNSDRVSLLISKGISAEEAKSIADIFVAHDDESFAKISNLFASKVQKDKEVIVDDDNDMSKEDDSDEDDKKAKKDKKVKAKVEEEDVADADLAVGGDINQEVEASRAAMALVFADFLKSN